jgi:hypothetical protein
VNVVDLEKIINNKVPYIKDFYSPDDTHFSKRGAKEIGYILANIIVTDSSIK